MEAITRRELAKPSPRSRLVPIVKVVEAVCSLSDGMASIPEICDLLIRCFDADRMMIYQGPGYGLAEAFDGSAYEEHSGFNERRDIVCELFNSQYWQRPNAQISVRREPLEASDFLISKRDSLLVADSLWREFFPPDWSGGARKRFPLEAFQNWIEGAHESQSKAIAKAATGTPPSDAGRWPWGSHSTELLEHLEAAASRFWANYDPSDSTTAPTNAQVIEWLEGRGVSNAIAKAMATILRVDGLPTGPRK